MNFLSEHEAYLFIHPRQINQIGITLKDLSDKYVIPSALNAWYTKQWEREICSISELITVPFRNQPGNNILNMQ